MKIALVHDYLREYGGAERVVEALHEIWPEAPLYTSFVDWKSLGEHAKRFENWDIRTSWVQHNPIVKKFHSPLRFLAPDVWESFDLSEFDVVITSSGWYMCRGVNAGRRTLETRFPIHDSRFKKNKNSNIENRTSNAEKSPIPMQICYIHHPPRNLYGYATGSTLQKYWPVRVYAAFINFFLRHYDFVTAQKVDYFIANSEETARRVQKFYRRESTVIYPPIDIRHSILDSRFSKKIPSNIENRTSNIDKSYYLSVGRLMWAKRIDLAIEACNRLKLPLKIVGRGPEEAKLREIAGPTIEFCGPVSDMELAQLYQGAKALLFCALDEDFGMVPVEAMGHGTPVIALAQGGVTETVVDGKTGILFSTPSIESLEDGIRRFLKFYHRFYQNNGDDACRTQAEKFNKKRFRQEIEKFVRNHTP
jgi:glycosyltransferase involved in cell wall biosynthesis